MKYKRAAVLAERIERFWSSRGFPVRAFVEKEPYHEKAQSAGYTVRSDLVNGLPPNATPALVRDLDRDLQRGVLFDA